MPGTEIAPLMRHAPLHILLASPMLAGDGSTELGPLGNALLAGCRRVEPVACLGQVASRALRGGPYDAIVLDVPELREDAIAAVGDVRREGLQLPLLVIAARRSAAQEELALNHGADDVIAGPAPVGVVVARLSAMVRRIAGHGAALLTCGNVAVDRARQTVSVDGRSVPVTSREFEVLEALLSRRSALLTKDRFMSRLYGEEEGPDQRIIDVFICKLRRKLAAAGAAEIVRTVWGLGYVAEEPGPAAVAAARARHAAGLPRARRAHLRPAAGFDLHGA
ncbi:response regulator transcription factor [Roseomonas frigidaquae]|uniref:Response regulator transcription factor n=1 Tax=Falsiroseomonas frigidaquae TaxID=487318 RepID=A0ABX1ERR2_9PROT|nr:response regulator transcription factor [Falsiroseomonas frigidaquae]NKE43319.1 response regulator transcription factor [Falsiroseomonas frigidaquae]